MTGMRAGIDIGSNSVRLLVLDEHGGTVLRRSEVTGLGRNARNAVLDAQSVQRTLESVQRAVAEAAEVGLHLSPANTRVVATAAARSAPNVRELIDDVARVSGLHVEVLSGADEAALSWRGAMAGLQRRNTAEAPVGLEVLVDIGGGSTEFAVGYAADPAPPKATWSLDIGCVRATEQFLLADPPAPEELSGIISVMQAHLEDVDREIPIVRHTSRFVGVAGSILTVAAVEIGRYDHDELHGFWLSRAAAEDVFRTVAQERSADRAFNPGLPTERVGTIVAGAALLVSILRHFELDGITVSVADLLDAVAASVV